MNVNSKTAFKNICLVKIALDKYEDFRILKIKIRLERLTG